MNPTNPRRTAADRTDIDRTFDRIDRRLALLCCMLAVHIMMQVFILALV